jgi:hypothetical protein
MEQYQSILEEEFYDIACETRAVKRKGKLDAATLVQMQIFGFWQDLDLRLSSLSQIGGRRKVHVTESAISQHFTPACATMFLRIMQRLAEVTLESEKVAIPLLKQFSAVIVEDGHIFSCQHSCCVRYSRCGNNRCSDAFYKIFSGNHCCLASSFLVCEIIDCKGSTIHCPLCSLHNRSMFPSLSSKFPFTRSEAHTQPVACRSKERFMSTERHRMPLMVASYPFAHAHPSLSKQDPQLPRLLVDATTQLHDTDTSRRCVRDAHDTKEGYPILVNLLQT